MAGLIDPRETRLQVTLDQDFLIPYLALRVLPMHLNMLHRDKCPTSSHGVWRRVMIRRMTVLIDSRNSASTNRILHQHSKLDILLPYSEIFDNSSALALRTFKPLCQRRSTISGMVCVIGTRNSAWACLTTRCTRCIANWQ